MRSLRPALAAFFFLVIAGASAQGQVFLTRWTFNGDDVVDMSVTTGFGPMTALPATASGALSSLGAGAGWAPSFSSYSPGDYFEFSLSATAGGAFAVDTISLVTSASLNGATQWEVRSTLDGYSTVLGTGVTDEAGSDTLHDLGLAVGPGQAFTFRVYGLGGNSDAIFGFSVDDVTVTGAVSAVPEPSTYAALAGAGALGLAWWRRRRGVV